MNLATAARSSWRQLGVTLEMIKIEHTLFALPFALTSMMLAAGGWPAARIVFWIVVAMVGARSAAMGFNRLVDREIDAENPRTATRALPAGLLAPGFVAAFVAAALALLVVAAWRLNPLCVKLVLVAIPVLLGYSYTKRFTWLAHLTLGVALGGAPLGAWIAVTGAFAPAPFALAGAVVTWVAGFDVLYALQDEAFDRARGLHSIPAKFGAVPALWISGALHLATLALLASLPALYPPGLGLVYWIGWAGCAALLAYQHAIVRPGDLSRLNAAFFTANGALALWLFAAVAIDLFLRRGGAAGVG
jgi:4-hydroxybenzoate polyprenyltransferase